MAHDSACPASASVPVTTVPDSVAAACISAVVAEYVADAHDGALFISVSVTVATTSSVIGGEPLSVTRSVSAADARTVRSGSVLATDSCPEMSSTAK